ncbi:hypothetical protein HGM15179_002641 [Zosterops borbonicus]|uniref:Uncharacterized protein n=1 Tax=Zosterops borbonicus TaxID=364589 RepID=A0A8K1GSB2_9PASS|nr:hypothetical protein HGM15179_002641 [Zosterops borbonicus]
MAGIRKRTFPSWIVVSGYMVNSGGGLLMAPISGAQQVLESVVVNGMGKERREEKRREEKRREEKRREEKRREEENKKLKPKNENIG